MGWLDKIIGKQSRAVDPNQEKPVDILIKKINAEETISGLHNLLFNLWSYNLGPQDKENLAEKIFDRAIYLAKTFDDCQFIFDHFNKINDKYKDELLNKMAHLASDLSKLIIVYEKLPEENRLSEEILEKILEQATDFNSCREILSITPILPSPRRLSRPEAITAYLAITNLRIAILEHMSGLARSVEELCEIHPFLWDDFEKDVSGKLMASTPVFKTCRIAHDLLRHPKSIELRRTMADKMVEMAQTNEEKAEAILARRLDNQL